MGISLEQRKAAAKAKIAKLKGMGGRDFAKRLDWRPKARIWLHTTADILERKTVWFAKIIEDKKTKKSKVIKIPFVTPEDPDRCAFVALTRALKEREDIDLDTVVLSVGKGKDRLTWKKGDIIGDDDFNFKNNLVPRKEALICAVMDKHLEDGEMKVQEIKECQILTAPGMVGRLLGESIDSQQDERGDEGNPYLNPYPFVLKYNKKASSPSEMYSVSPFVGEECPEAILKLIEGPAPNTTQMTQPDDPDAMYMTLRDALEVDLPEFVAPKSDIGATEGAGGDEDDQEDEPLEDEDTDNVEEADGDEEDSDEEEDAGEVEGDDGENSEESSEEDTDEEEDEESDEENDEEESPPSPQKKSKPTVPVKAKPASKVTPASKAALKSKDTTKTTAADPRDRW